MKNKFAAIGGLLSAVGFILLIIAGFSGQKWLYAVGIPFFVLSIIFSVIKFRGLKNDKNK